MRERYVNTCNVEETGRHGYVNVTTNQLFKLKTWHVHVPLLCYAILLLNYHDCASVAFGERKYRSLILI